MPKKKLTLKQQKFIAFYLVDLNGTQAAIKAGYSKKTARVVATENLAKPAIKAEVDRARAKWAAEAEISQAFVLEGLKENLERSLQRVPVMQDGKPTGEWKYEGSVANRSLELLGRHIGMFKEKVEVDTTDRLSALLEAIQDRPRPGPVIEHETLPQLRDESDQDSDS